MQDDSISIKTPEYVSLQFQAAGLGSRSLAFIIDQFILMVMNIAIIVLLVLFMEGSGSAMVMFDSMTVPVAIAIILIFLINTCYFFVLEYFTGGRTIGKKILGLRVIQDNGHSITLLSSIIRNFMRLIDSLPTGYLVGILMIFFHSQHKRLGDMVAGTLVVHERGKKKGKSKKASGIEMVLATRKITKAHLDVEEWALKSLGMKEWQLLKAYCERFVSVPDEDRYELSRKLADVLLVKIGVDFDGKDTYEIENMLLALYLHMRDEWEYEL